MELVTIHNIDFTRKVKLTHSGLDLHKECEYKGVNFNLETTFYISPGDTYERSENDKWCGILCTDGIDTESEERYGVRIGDGNFFDICYCDTYCIDTILSDLDLLTTKLK